MCVVESIISMGTVDVPFKANYLKASIYRLPNNIGR